MLLAAEAASSAPPWLKYVSTAALVVSCISFMLSFATYRRAGPRIKVRAAKAPPHWRPSSGDLPIDVTVINTGLAPIQIVSMRCVVLDRQKAWSSRRRMLMRDPTLV